MNVARKWRRRLSPVLAASLCAACSVTSGIRQSFHNAFPPDEPIALVRLQGPFAPGKGGQMVGYLRKWPATGPNGETGGKTAMFTYVTEFKVVDISHAYYWLPRLAEGKRLVYFHPKGARASFADANTFERGELVETDFVRFHLEYSGDLAQLRLLQFTKATASKPFEYDGRVFSVVVGHEEAAQMYGRPSPQFNGWLMTSPDT